MTTISKNGVILSNPIVSAVMTTYNLKPYVEESLRSVLAQTYYPLEIVISDDGSTDGTWETITRLVDEYRSGGGRNKIVLNRNDKNLGCMRNFEKVVSLTHGRVFVEFDGDDISRPDRVVRIMDEFTKDPKLKALKHDGSLIDSKGKKLWGGLFSTWAYCDWDPLGAAMAFTKDVVTDWPKSDPDGYQDGVWLFRAVMSGHVAQIDDCLIYYRQGSGGSSSKDRKKIARSCMMDVKQWRQVLADMEYKKNQLPAELCTKINRFVKNKISYLELLYDLSVGSFNIRFRRFKYVISKSFRNAGLMHIGPYLDLVYYGVLLLPVGQLNCIVESIQSFIWKIRLKK